MATPRVPGLSSPALYGWTHKKPGWTILFQRWNEPCVYAYGNAKPLVTADPLGLKACPPDIYNKLKKQCMDRNKGANRTWVIFGCKYNEFKWPNGSCTRIGYPCCFGPCQFYEGWCKWGANLPANDPGKPYWKLSVADCERCADQCALAGGKWSCFKGGGKRRPDWPSNKNPYVPVWDDELKPAVLECEASSAVGK